MAASIDGFSSSGTSAGGLPLHAGLESFSGNPTLPSQSMPGEVSGSNWASDPVQFIRSMEERLESFAASRGEHVLASAVGYCLMRCCRCCDLAITPADIVSHASSHLATASTAQVSYQSRKLSRGVPVDKSA